MKQLLTTIFFGISLFVSAQTSLIPDMKFRRLDTPDGLSSSQINCIFKDSRGFVWIGTPYGLNRYDGYRVKTFYSNKRDTTTMRDNYTDKIYEDGEGKLWMRQGMNYCVYDPKTESFERNASRVLSKMGLNCAVEWLYIDSKKNIWVKDFQEAIYCHHPGKKGGRTTKIKLGYGDKEFNPGYGISTVAELDDKLIVATNSGELVCMNGERGEVEWVDKWMHDNIGIENQEYRIYVDKDGNIWCQVLDTTTAYIKKEKKWHGSLSEFFASRGIEGVPSPLMVWNLLIDKKNRLWLVCDHEALVVVDLNSKQWKQFKNNKYDETTLSDNTLRNIYQFDDGTIWIGSYKNGVNQYVSGLSSLKTVELGDINTVCEDKSGNYWLGTNDAGILVYNPKTEEVVNHFTKDNSGLAGNIVVGSWAASDGTIWFGSYNGGLTHCLPVAGNPSQATIVNYQATGDGKGLANNSVWALTEDKWGRIWFSTLGGGLQMYDLKTHKFTTWDTKNTKIQGDYLTSVGWNKKGWLMVGTGYFYSLVNPVSNKLINQVIPDDPNIPTTVGATNYVIEDSRGLIWHGSNVGIIVYDPKTKFQKLIDMTDGLFGSGINSLVEDKTHAVWAVTDHGISQINPHQQDDGTWQFNIRSFNSRDGLQKATYNQRSTWLTRDGKVLVGGQGGLDIINPAMLEDEKSKERPVFSGLQIFDRNVEVGKAFDGRVILDEALDDCRELNLRFNDQFTIQLSTNEVNIKNLKRFAYKLEGFNDNWVKTSEQNPNITFNSLRAGSYTLCVRILKDDGSLGEEESRLDITIRPPFWRTRWMILLYMLLVAIGVWFWRKWYMKKTSENMELQKLRIETEKRQWMSEVRTQMMKEMSQQAPQGEQVEVIDEKDVVVEDEPRAAAAPTKPKLHKTTDDLVTFVRTFCDHVEEPAGKNLKLTFNATAESVFLPFDAAHLNRALTILIQNSLKFTPSTCKIQMTVMQPTPSHAVILVADNGVGVSDEFKVHMFDPMIGEEGIGLDKVKEVVDAHHGTIKAEDNPGGGTVFTISLPVEDPEVEEAVLVDE